MVQAPAYTEALHTSLAGRARFRVAGLKHDELLKYYIEEQFSAREDSLDAAASSVTGNTLVNFSARVSWQEAQAALEQTCESFHREQRTKIAKRAHVNSFRAPLRTARHRVNGSVQLRDGDDSNGIKWHSLNEVELLQTLETSPVDGLSSAVVAARRSVYGNNELTKAHRRTSEEIFFHQFNSLPVALLVGSAALSVLTGGAFEAVVILAVVGANAFIGYKTESLAEKTINLLSLVGPAHLLVIRDGNGLKILSHELVVGDIFLVTVGLAVPADARILKSEMLLVDESALTGENLPVAKLSGHVEGDVGLSDRLNMLYRGTIVTGGNGVAVVVAVGDQTELGKIQSLVQNTEQFSTPIQLQLEALTSQLILLSGGLGLAIFGVGVLRGFSLIEMLKMSLTLAVAAVPEGLPTMATVSLTQSASRMKERQVLVRTLGAVEALGATQVICLDKTGTLTMNHMSALEIVTPCENWHLENGIFISAHAGASWLSSSSGVRELLLTAVLCSEADIAFSRDAKPIFNGSPTEVALVEMAYNAGLELDSLRSGYPLMATQLRTEEMSFMVTLHDATSDQPGTQLFAVKGNPEEVLNLCKKCFLDGKTVALTPELRAAVLRENDRLGAAALRVLGFATFRTEELVESESLHLHDFVWLGLVAMADQPRDGIKELMASFHAAGIKTVMITGDQSATAAAVGKSVGISGRDDIHVFDWSQVAHVDPQELIEIAKRTDVFARVSPSEKLQIVQALQAAGNVVAMVGDGINDAPALKAADVGIAMGFKGADAARAVADVVIMDDRLQSLLPGIKLGRTTYDSIQKSVNYLLTTNMSETLLMFFSISAGVGQPLNSMQILWINLISDLFPAMALALELPDSQVLERAPRARSEPLLGEEEIKQIAIKASVMSLSALSAYSYGYRRYGASQKSQTIAFTSLAVAQLLHTFSARSDSRSVFDKNVKPNKYVTMTVGGGVSLQMLPLIVPPLRALLDVSPIGMLDFGVSLAGSALNFFYNEVQVRSAGANSKKSKPNNKNMNSVNQGEKYVQAK